MHVFVWVCACVLRHKLSCCNVLSVWLLIKAEICGLVSISLPSFPRYLFRFFLLLLSSLDHSLAFFLFLSRRFSAVCQFGSFNQQSTHICQSERSWDMPGVEEWREEERGEGRGLSGKCCNMYTTRRTLSTVLPTSSATATATEPTYLSNAKRQPEIY